MHRRHSLTLVAGIVLGFGFLASGDADSAGGQTVAGGVVYAEAPAPTPLVVDEDVDFCGDIRASRIAAHNASIASRT